MIKLLSKDDCKKCRFCCSFKHESLWGTPIFSLSQKNNLEKKYKAKFIKTNKNSFTIDLLGCYKSTDESEEAACYFLGSQGCVLSKDEMPFDCAIWPLRVALRDNEIYVVYEQNCPVLNKISLEKIKELLTPEFIRTIKNNVYDNPDIIKAWNQSFVCLQKLDLADLENSSLNFLENSKD